MENAGKMATTRENGSMENRGFPSECAPFFSRKLMHDGEPVLTMITVRDCGARSRRGPEKKTAHR